MLLVDFEKFCIRSLQESGLRVISIVIKGEEGRINFRHALAEMFATRPHRIKYGRICMVETFSNCFRSIRFKLICGVQLGLISYLHFFCAISVESFRLNNLVDLI